MINNKGEHLVIGPGMENSALVSLVVFTHTVQKKIVGNTQFARGAIVDATR